MKAIEIDGVLLEWGARLFYGQRKAAGSRGKDPLPSAAAVDHPRATDIRAQIRQLIAPRAHQVMVKITGGGKGMKAIAAHLNYISKRGGLEMENERGEVVQGKGVVNDLRRDWQLGGPTALPDISHRREAHHVILSMPRGTPAEVVHQAARAFAKEELANHVYAMVLHDHQANPHVHIAVRAEGLDGRRLNPRKADLARWRATFARELQDRGIAAVASYQPTRGVNRNHPKMWRVQAEKAQRARTAIPAARATPTAQRTRLRAFEAWAHVHEALEASTDRADRALAKDLQAWLLRDEAQRTRRQVAPGRDPEVSLPRERSNAGRSRT